MAVADIQVTQTAAAAVPSPVATYSPSKNSPVWLSRGPAGECWRLLADFFTAVTLALGCCRWRGHCLAECLQCPQCVQCPH